MFLVKLSEEQIKFMFALLDAELKRDGLGALQAVVDLHNAVASAQVLEKSTVENLETDLPRS